MRSEEDIQGTIDLQKAYLAQELDRLVRESDPVEVARLASRINAWRNRIEMLEWVLAGSIVNPDPALESLRGPHGGAFAENQVNALNWKDALNEARRPDRTKTGRI